MDFLSSMLGSKKNNSSEGAKRYKEGYEAAEKKYKQIADERDIAYHQLKKLNYAIGEEPSVLKEASVVKKNCKSRTSCNGCDFEKNDQCVLSGKNPSDWAIL